MTDEEFKDQVVFRARAALTEAQEAVEFAPGTLRAAIPLALAALHLRSKKDSTFRENFLVETDFINIATGSKAECKTALDAKGILPSDIPLGRIIFDYTDVVFPEVEGWENQNIPEVDTVQFIRQRDRLRVAGIADKFYILCYVEGTTLYFKHPGYSVSIPTTVKFKIKAPAHTLNLALLPEALIGFLATEVVETVKRAHKPNKPGIDLSAEKV